MWIPVVSVPEFPAEDWEADAEPEGAANVMDAHKATRHSAKTNLDPTIFFMLQYQYKGYGKPEQYVQEGIRLVQKENALAHVLATNNHTEFVVRKQERKS